MVGEPVGDAIRAVLREYGATLDVAPALVPDSISAENYRVETNRGTFFVKRYRESRPRDRMAREQAAIAWAAANGLPVARPLATQRGETLHECEGRWWSVSPWVKGSTYRRGQMSPAGAEHLGAVHGRTHRVLAAHPIRALPPNSELTWDTAASVEILKTLGPHVRDRGDDRERRMVRKQRELLESGIARPSSEFSGIPMQATHGDFHERNVMIDETGEVAAIVDWERFCVQPPAFEVLRAVSFVLLLEQPLLSAYLRGYRRETSLDETTIEPAIEAWRQSAMHNTWALRDYFLQGNPATRQFFAEEEARARLFNDSAFREQLAETFLREAC